MKICVVGPSKEFSTSAGWRIRYGRLAQVAEESDCEIEHCVMSDLVRRQAFEHDLFVFVKTVTSLAYVVGCRTRDAGCSSDHPDEQARAYIGRPGAVARTTYRLCHKGVVARTGSARNRSRNCLFSARQQSNIQPLQEPQSCSYGAGGAQVIASGYPLYRELEGLTLDGLGALVSGLENDALPLRSNTIPNLANALLAYADPFRCLEILKAAVVTARAARPAIGANPTSEFSLANMRNMLRTGFTYDLGIIHGKIVTGDAHKAITKLGGLSVKSPITKGAVNFHVRVDLHAGRHSVHIEESLLDLVPHNLRNEVTSRQKILETDYVELPLEAFALPTALVDAKYWQLSSRAAELASAASQITFTASICETLFPGMHFFFSEGDPMFLSRV